MMPMRPALAVLSLALLVPSAFAQDEQPMQLQWQKAPDVTLRQLVDKGFEIKAVYQHDTELGSGHSELVTYILQKGSEVYRCFESAIVEVEGQMISQVVQCNVLAAPVDSNKKSIG